MLTMTWPKIGGGKEGGRVYQGGVEGERLRYNAIVRSPCGNTVLTYAFDLALYLSLNKLGKLAQLVGKELIRHGRLGGTNFTAPKQSGALPEIQVSYSNKSLIPEASSDCLSEVP